MLTLSPERSGRRSFELFVAGRYLRAKRKEKFISIVTLLSVAGVAVATEVLPSLVTLEGLSRVFRPSLCAWSQVKLTRRGEVCQVGLRPTSWVDPPRIWWK